MKRGKIDKKKEITKIRSKKTKNFINNKRTKEREPDLWKEVYSGLKLLGKKYKNIREKQKIKRTKRRTNKIKRARGTKTTRARATKTTRANLQRKSGKRR